MTKNLLHCQEYQKTLDRITQQNCPDASKLLKPGTVVIFAQPLRFLPLLEPAPSGTYSFDASAMTRAKANKRPVDAIDGISHCKFYISFTNQGKLQVWQLESEEQKHIYGEYRKKITELAEDLFISQSSSCITALTVADFKTCPGWRFAMTCPFTGSFFHVESKNFRLHGKRPLDKFFWNFPSKAPLLKAFFTQHAHIAIMGRAPYVHGILGTTQKLLSLLKSSADAVLDPRFILKDKAQGTVPAGQNAAPKYALWVPQTYVHGIWQPPSSPLPGLRA